MFSETIQQQGVRLPPFSELFPTPGLIEFEIGCGKGKFLLASSTLYPERNFIGIDRAGKWMRIGQKKHEKRNLKNLTFIKADVREILEQVPPSSVSVFHAYFPDPWPKRRHRKRRLLTLEFLACLHDRLMPSGLVEFATDDLDYFAQVKTLLASPESVAWSQVRESVNARLFRPEIKTNYELKYEATGRNLYYLELAK